MNKYSLTQEEESAQLSINNGRNKVLDGRSHANTHILRGLEVRRLRAKRTPKWTFAAELRLMTIDRFH